MSRKSHQRETTLSVIVEYCSDLGRRPVALRPIRPYQIVIHGPILPNSGPTRLTGLPDGYVETTQTTVSPNVPPPSQSRPFAFQQPGSAGRIQWNRPGGGSAFRRPIAASAFGGAFAGGDDDDGGVDSRARAVPERCPSRRRADVHSCWLAINTTGPEHRRFAAPWPGELWLSWLTSHTLIVSCFCRPQAKLLLFKSRSFNAVKFRILRRFFGSGLVAS